ncbi:MAG: hypothetical protein EOP06_00385 [Proteobacteria bacterium]|nr:MAG: hypothetical protein EOP06_00385 [Pseudomonadota bacterium]
MTTKPNIVNLEADVVVSPSAFLGTQMRQVDIHDLMHIWASVEASLAKFPEAARDDVRNMIFEKFSPGASEIDWSRVHVTDQEADAMEHCATCPGCETCDQLDATEEAIADGYLDGGNK